MISPLGVYSESLLLQLCTILHKNVQKCLREYITLSWLSFYFKAAACLSKIQRLVSMAGQNFLTRLFSNVLMLYLIYSCTELLSWGGVSGDSSHLLHSRFSEI